QGRDEAPGDQGHVGLLRSPATSMLASRVRRSSSNVGLGTLAGAPAKLGTLRKSRVGSCALSALARRLRTGGDPVSRRALLLPALTLALGLALGHHVGAQQPPASPDLSGEWQLAGWNMGEDPAGEPSYRGTVSLEARG